jgi:predicted permease
MPFEYLARDLQFGLRNLRRSPGFALAAVLSLVLGIGVNAAIFTLLNGLVLKTLPVPHPERLVEVQAFNKPLAEYENFYSYPFYRELVARNSIFEKVAAEWGYSLFELRVGEKREQVRGIYVSGTYFDFLHATPYLGRLLDKNDEATAGAHGVCVLSYRLWRRNFSADPHIVGTTISLNDKRLEVVGVTKPEFTGLELQNSPELELPMSAVDYVAQSMHRDDPQMLWLQIIARLKPGISEQAASASLTALALRIKEAIPKHGPDADFNIYRVKPAPRGFGEQSAMARPLIVLMSTVALLLLIACLNLVNLLLARGQAREREIAMRISLGASRWRIIRQLMIENAYLAHRARPWHCPSLMPSCLYFWPSSTKAKLTGVWSCHPICASSCLPA